MRERDSMREGDSMGEGDSMREANLMRKERKKGDDEGKQQGEMFNLRANDVYSFNLRC